MSNDETGWTRDGNSSAGWFIFDGERVSYQLRIPYRTYTIPAFVALLQELSSGFEKAAVTWSEPTGDDGGLWIQASRVATAVDRERLARARTLQAKDDEYQRTQLRKRHPEWFVAEAQ